ncbi:hypothetical protein N7535_001206 [Penicillium sp. DV-2018c]|nr:hypothetical protein N7535_001206 [Penicillium sp. DV-2018c]
MSSSYSAWFRKGPELGIIITLDQPVPSQWKILEKLNEHDYQVNEEENDEYGFRSFASAKYLCCDPRAETKKAFMRIYVQVPHRKTERDDADTRSRQATTYNPPELIAYRDLTEKGSSNTPKLLGYKTDKQDLSGLVPGYEREQVRSAFLQALPKLHENGWFPRVYGASSLVWHRETQTLYFIGPFEKAGKPERPIMFGANWIAHFDLSKPDPSTDERVT